MPHVPELTDELDPEAVRIGTAIREFRKTRGVTLAELGAAVGHTHSYLSKIERGLLKAPVPLCHSIADALDIRRAAIITPDIAAPAAEQGGV